MKQIALFLLAAGITLSLHAQAKIPEYKAVSGQWTFAGERLYQNDAGARLAKVNFRVPQNGPMRYEFNVRYEGGAEDGHGGFGIHVFSDTAYNGASWGCGRSYLIWFNYDKKPLSAAIPAGLSAQIYRSYTNSRMDLIKSVSLEDHRSFFTEEALSAPIPFKIEVYGDTGQIKVFDPFVEDQYYFFEVNPRDIPLKGDWVALRTNGLKLSFALEQ
jgi:hypothetical protein